MSAIMMVKLALLALPAFANSNAEKWPPWPRTTFTTTTTLPNPTRDFGRGFINAFGFQDVDSCWVDGKVAYGEVRTAIADWKKGKIGQLEALRQIIKAGAELSLALRPCEMGQTDAIRVEQIVRHFVDKRFWTKQNGATLLLNMVEEHKELDAFVEELQANNYYGAGQGLGKLLIDVLEDPGFETDNSTAPYRVAQGILEGFTKTVDNKCFQDARIELTEATDALEKMLKANIPGGLMQLLRALEGALPTYRDCKADRPEIEALIHSLENLRHPEIFIKTVAANIMKNKLDISIEIAAAALAHEGKEWQHFGVELGKLLSNLLVVPTTTATPKLIIV